MLLSYKVLSSLLQIVIAIVKQPIGLYQYALA